MKMRESDDRNTPDTYGTTNPPTPPAVAGHAVFRQGSRQKTRPRTVSRELQLGAALPGGPAPETPHFNRRQRLLHLSGAEKAGRNQLTGRLRRPATPELNERIQFPAPKISPRAKVLSDINNSGARPFQCPVKS